MQRPKVLLKDTEEARIRDRISAMLALRQWTVMRTHGNKYQKGFPDLYCLHHSYGAKWIEIKKPSGSTITEAQQTVFPKIDDAKHGIWILSNDTEEEYRKLFRDPNWWNVMASSLHYKRGTIDRRHYLVTAPGENPEALLQNEVMNRLRSKGWTCLPTCGNMYQHGFPDVYALHKEHGARWVEIKRLESYSFTPAQKFFFPQISIAKHKIYIVTNVSNCEDVILGPENWYGYMKG